MRMSRHLLCASIALTLVACSGPIRDRKVDGPYRLMAIDDPSATFLCRDLGDGLCAGDGLPEPTVFAAGANARFVAIARHPLTYGGVDRSVTEYFYVVRGAETDPKTMPFTKVVGPLNASRFAKEKARLGLPDFSTIVDDLK